LFQGSRKDLTSVEDSHGQCSEVSPTDRDPASAASKNAIETHIPVHEEQPTDQDILKSIEDIYFSSSDFDPSKYELLVCIIYSRMFYCFVFLYTLYLETKQTKFLEAS
jgi:hypothetical protein